MTRVDRDSTESGTWQSVLVEFGEAGEGGRAVPHAQNEGEQRKDYLAGTIR